MSRYFSIFKDASAWDASKGNLDYPHVSLMDDTGDLKYAVYTGKSISDASFGDLLMVNLTNNKLSTIVYTDYNFNDYPWDTYKPIAICIFDKESNANNEAVFLSVHGTDLAHLGYGTGIAGQMTYGFYGTNIGPDREVEETGEIIEGLDITGITDREGHVSSIVINDAIKPYV